MNIIVKLLRDSGVQKIDSQYNKTMKNQQVSDYYSKCGFSLVCESNGNIEYCLVINNYKNKELEYIRVIDER
jgi:predicted enzyme involved in methoxymalonyl-ACP biosynthesis